MSRVETQRILASELAGAALASLRAEDWRRLGKLAARHTRGEISLDGWHNATLAILAPAFDTAERASWAVEREG